ncbi:MAG: YifB family Mg chelatase-like AAA ATPase, partial [Lachnospiraceae bacterium]|nr:YifB family Mg chelatase-like AAA ATPase [Lachnospiraceae bacterium]
APADIRKEGTSYDLPICMAILKSLDVIKNDAIDEYAFIGELNLQGDVVGVNGILPMVSHLKSEGVKGVFVPKKNEQEALLVDNIDIISVSNIKEIIDALSDNNTINIKRPTVKKIEEKPMKDIMDFSDICGQHLLKRAVEVAVAGRHNIIISGPAGTGKTMIAKRIPTIMPDLTKEEAIEITKIYSIAGKLDNNNIISTRPFRSPHHSTSVTSLIGGGIYPMPGDISLASGGVLFLDELPLFSTMCLENLREPLEEKEICISRLKGSYKYPANFMLVASMNLCPCSYYPDRNKCNCTDAEIKRYQRGVSRPLLERIDICAESREVGAFI